VELKGKTKMRNQKFTTRRGTATATDWIRNHNTVRHTSGTLGPIFQTASLGVLVLIVGLIYATQGARATNYDYELSNIESQIAELEAKKEDLAVERARLTSIAASETSEVAVAMENATVSGYAK
jgi:hypothetical protein